MRSVSKFQSFFLCVLESLSCWRLDRSPHLFDTRRGARHLPAKDKNKISRATGITSLKAPVRHSSKGPGSTRRRSSTSSDIPHLPHTRRRRRRHIPPSRRLPERRMTAEAKTCISVLAYIRDVCPVPFLDRLPLPTQPSRQGSHVVLRQIPHGDGDGTPDGAVLYVSRAPSDTTTVVEGNIWILTRSRRGRCRRRRTPVLPQEGCVHYRRIPGDNS